VPCADVDEGTVYYTPRKRVAHDCSERQSAELTFITLSESYANTLYIRKAFITGCVPGYRAEPESELIPWHPALYENENAP